MKNKLNVKNGAGNTMLIDAVRANNEIFVKELMKLKCDVNIANNKGDSALRIASKSPHRRVE